MEADTGERRDGSALERGVRPLHEEVRALAYERAGGHTSSEDGTYDPELLYVMCLAADELKRLSDALATESSRKCATEHDCVWQPHCSHARKCMRPERPFVA